MRIIKIYVFLNLLSYLFTSCVEPYEATEISDLSYVVVDGRITDEKEAQSIILSKSTSIIFPTFNPISGANLIVTDKRNNVFEFSESYESKGTYNGNIAAEFLIPGNAFKLNFITTEGAVYESVFEPLLACPDIDSLYYNTYAEFYEGNNNYPTTGIEFYVDINADDTYSRYYKWQLDETYEYHATWPIKTYYFGRWITKDSENWDYFICYKTEPVQTLFSTTTSNLDENVYLRYPLNFVNTESQRLYFKYSLLVKQMSLSERAFNYFEELKENNQTSGGLYDKQPANVNGNIVCISNPNEKVLGYFGVSSIKTKRISLTMNDLKDHISFTNNVFCVADLQKHPEWILKTKRASWPIYTAPVPDGEPDGIYYAPQYCFDCRINGGLLVEPDFWKDN